MMIRAHKIRLHPTPEQAIYSTRAAGTARFTFNWAVGEWKKQYEAGEKPKELARRTKGGQNWLRTKEKLARLHYEVACKRADYLTN